MASVHSEERIDREKQHGAWIAYHGEEVWNWSSPAGKLRWGRRVAMFQEFLGSPGISVLEIGCGTGLFTAEIAAKGHRLTAIDISPDLIALARERVTSDNVTFMVENAYATTFPDAGFDAIIGSSCLHHLDIARALPEFYRLLKPGGRIMFTEPNMLNPQIFLQKNIPVLKRMAGDSPDETAFVRFTLAAELGRAGFRNITIKPFDFVHPALPSGSLGMAEPLLNALEAIPLVREIAGSLVITASHP